VKFKYYWTLFFLSFALFPEQVEINANKVQSPKKRQIKRAIASTEQSKSATSKKKKKNLERFLILVLVMVGSITPTIRPVFYQMTKLAVCF
jgi:hypothetical protein